MKKKFINKNITPKCEYCIHSTDFSDNSEKLCKYKGIVENSNSCRKFKYDILKRKPQKQNISKDYQEYQLYI